ncbi:MAG: DUF4249 domain-containing protein [Bacteroidales bacterium]|nr:DUF4249 domain-containing protein [Bacteroidales bacterium]
MKNTFIFLFLFALALCGCRKQVSDYERPDFDPQPTLNAVLQEDQPVWAQVSFAQGLDSVHPAPCTNAEVLLYVDGQFTEKLQHDGKGRYVGETTAEALHEYAYKVVVPGFDTLFAQTEMPEKPVVTLVEIMENATVDEEGNPCPAFLVTFKTDPNKKEYYQMNMDALFRNDYASGYSFSKGTITSSINTDDPVLLNEGSDRLLFSNEIITETDYTLKVNSTFGNHGWGGNHSGTVVRSGYVVVRMHGLSESAYHYMKSQNAFEEPDAYSNLFLGVISPINLYSNVENGRGVFAAIAPMTCDTVFINPKN